MIILLQEHLQEIYTHAESIYPEECCGLLLGEIDGEKKVVTEVWQTENSWNEDELVKATDGLVIKKLSKRNRFSIASEVMLKAQKEARTRNLSIMGIYHSHPDNPAVPSEFDRAIAWQQYSYIIVSVRQGKAEDILSWTLDDNHQFQQEEIRVEGKKRMGEW